MVIPLGPVWTEGDYERKETNITFMKNSACLVRKKEIGRRQWVFITVGPTRIFSLKTRGNNREENIALAYLPGCLHPSLPAFTPAGCHRLPLSFFPFIAHRPQLVSLSLPWTPPPPTVDTIIGTHHPFLFADITWRFYTKTKIVFFKKS